MRIIAILATYNEERFIAGCLENLFQQGVEVYLCDNESMDRTVSIAESYRDRGLIGIEVLPRHGVYAWVPILKRKEQLASTLEADWFMHIDADEIHLPPRSSMTLAAAIGAVEADGYSAVNFVEYTFTPTEESPDHDHPDFQRTMRWYYPFQPVFPLRLNAWKRQEEPVDLVSSGGHQVRFPGLRMAPQSFAMRHYLFLSKEHAIRKFVDRHYDPEEVKAGMHGWRAMLTADMITLPHTSDLRTYTSDDELDPSNPRTKHFLDLSVLNSGEARA